GAARATPRGTAPRRGTRNPEPRSAAAGRRRASPVVHLVDDEDLMADLLLIQEVVHEGHEHQQLVEALPEGHDEGQLVRTPRGVVVRLPVGGAGGLWGGRRSSCSREDISPEQLSWSQSRETSSSTMHSPNSLLVVSPPGCVAVSEKNIMDKVLFLTLSLVLVLNQVNYSSSSLRRISKAQVNVTLEKEVAGFWVKVPCLEEMGSCHYKDAGSYSLPQSDFTLPTMDLPYWLSNGNYRVQGVLGAEGKELGCLKLALSLHSD
ncbi:hypothetical protein F7725_010595, partial [Dissostichus mawsoni]